MTPFSGRRNASIDSRAASYAAAGRREKPFVALEDQSPEDQYIFTSLRYDAHAKSNKLNPECCKEARSTYLFKYHFDRLKDGTGCRGWYDAQKRLKRPIDLYNRVVNAVAAYEQKNGISKHKLKHNGAYKVRIMLSYYGEIKIDVSPDSSPFKKGPLLYPTTLDHFDIKHEASNRAESFTVVLDALPTTKSLHTKSKTEWRPMYDYARTSAGIHSYQDPKEVLLFNCDGEIMDGSITTPYFYRNGGWVTPHTSCGGQTGTTRRWAVDQGLCTLGTVEVDSLRPDETIWLSNAVKGFFTARFVASPDRCCAPSFRSTTWSLSTASSISNGTSIDTPVSEMSRSSTWLPPMIEVDDNDLSPCCTREAPVSPTLEACHVRTTSGGEKFLDLPFRSKKPLFRMPQFSVDSVPEERIDYDIGPKSPSSGEYNVDPLSYQHAAFCL